MARNTTSGLLAIRVVSTFALLVACGILVAIAMGKSDLPIPIPMMLFVAGLALSVVASAKAKNVPPKE
jgi:hypothetical protein